MGLCCGASQARRDRSADYEERRKQELLEALGDGAREMDVQPAARPSANLVNRWGLAAVCLNFVGVIVTNGKI